METAFTYLEISETKSFFKTLTKSVSRLNNSSQKEKNLHLIAHGSEKGIAAGPLLITEKILQDNSSLLRSWEIDNIYLWACEIGKNTNFITTLEELTGANIFASECIIDKEKPFIKNKGGKKVSFEKIIGKEKFKTWRGSLSSTQVLDTKKQILDFSNSKATGLDGAGEVGSEFRVNESFIYDSIININGQNIDALVKYTSNGNVNKYVSLDDDDIDAAYISSRILYSDSGKANLSISFYENGTYTAPGTGNKVTLENVVVNSYDIDYNQYQEFKGFQRYEIGSDPETSQTTLTVSESDGFVRFEDDNNQITSGTDDKGRVRIYYDSIEDFELTLGSSKNGAHGALFYLDFQMGPDWTDNTILAQTPAPYLQWSQRSLSEDIINNGSTSTKIIISLENSGTTTFAGVDGDPIDHTNSNISAGLTSSVVRTSTTTAELTLTGNATNHQGSNSLNNISIGFTDNSFQVGTVKASDITDTIITNISIDFLDNSAALKLENASENTVENTLEKTNPIADYKPESNFQTDIDFYDFYESYQTTKRPSTLFIDTAQEISLLGRLNNDISSNSSESNQFYSAILIDGGYGAIPISLQRDASLNEIPKKGVKIITHAMLSSTNSRITQNKNSTNESFFVVLTGAPTSDITVALNVPDSLEGILSKSVLTFTPENWNIPQEVLFSEEGVKKLQVRATANNEGGYTGSEHDSVILNNSEKPIKQISTGNNLTEKRFEEEPINLDVERITVHEELSPMFTILRIISFPAVAFISFTLNSIERLQSDISSATHSIDRNNNHHQTSAFQIEPTVIGHLNGIGNESDFCLTDSSQHSSGPSSLLLAQMSQATDSYF
ncbi:DUF4347 domain-containing protein [Synechococcus sp. AH-707-B22]|nr:DUF4347 domain-containing protein [Synechococcus sp. AH-707-B22]